MIVPEMQDLRSLSLDLYRYMSSLVLFTMHSSVDHVSHCGRNRSLANDNAPSS